MSVVFPKTPAEARTATGEYRAGGTDLQDRRHLGIATGPLVDLRDVEGLGDIEEVDEGLVVGAKVTLNQLAARVAERWPALGAAAGGLATPQIRAVGTLGGNLVQHVRCWYYRNPAYDCLKKSGSVCFARDGDHRFHACFDQGPCVAPHPSTVGMALLAYDAEVQIDGAEWRSMADFFGDGSRVERNDTLDDGDLITAVRLPPPTPGERSAYFRTISRARAEWPLIEAVARLVLEGDGISLARVVIGGVARVPLRREAVEAALVGGPATDEALAAAAELATEGADPLPGTAYKVDLLPGTVLEVLERAAAATPVGEG